MQKATFNLNHLLRKIKKKGKKKKEKVKVKKVKNKKLLLPDPNPCGNYGKEDYACHPKSTLGNPFVCPAFLSR